MKWSTREVTLLVSFSVVLVSKSSFSFTLVFYQNYFRFWYSFGVPIALFLDFSFNFGIDIVQLTFNLQCIFEKDYILNFKINPLRTVRFLKIRFCHN